MCLKFVKKINLMLLVNVLTKKHTKGHKETFRSDGYIFYIDFGDGITNVYICSNLQMINYVQFLYAN